MLLKKLSYVRSNVNAEVLNEVDLHSYRIQYKYTQDLELSESDGEMEGMSPGGDAHKTEEEFDLLTNIIKVLNETYGADLTDEDQVDAKTVKENVFNHEELMMASNANNSIESIREKFNEVVNDEFLRFVNTKIDFYSKMTEQRTNEMYKQMLFNEFRRIINR